MMKIEHVEFLTDEILSDENFRVYGTLLFDTQVRPTPKLTYLMTAYYTPDDGFTANNASFYKNKVG